jgi:glycerophosphoryl diester phosphodiesterase
VTADRGAALHAAGLEVWTWTLRAENAFLPPEHRRGEDPAAHGDWRAAWGALLDAGVDAVFADQPDLAVALRDDRG